MLLSEIIEFKEDLELLRDGVYILGVGNFCMLGKITFFY